MVIILSFKKVKILAVFGIFILSFIAHNIYQMLPNILVSFFFPINESIFEHMKIIFTSTIIYGLIDYLLLVKNKIYFNNFSFQLFFTGFISILIFLVIYLPIHYLFSENLIVTLGILFITYIIGQFISSYLLKGPEFKFLNIISIFLIVLVYINFIVLTYTFDKDDFFYDTSNVSIYIDNK